MQQLWNQIRNVSPIGLTLGLLFSMPASAELPPTARYAQGKDVDLELIIEEWQSRMPDIPIYACTCQEDSCETKPRWPLRSYKKNEPLVALGPFNADYNVSKGFKCEILADAEVAAEAEVDQPKTEAGTTAKIVNDRRSLEITHNGQTRTIDSRTWDITIVDALDCDQLAQVPSKRLNVLRLTDYIAVDQLTGQVAVGALLSECVETHQSAVFVVNPAVSSDGNGDWSVYRLMVPGPQTLPSGSSSYPLFSLSGLTYMDGHLLVGENTVADNAAVLVFKAGPKTAGTYFDCVELGQGENPDGLCPQR